MRLVRHAAELGHPYACTAKKSESESGGGSDEEGRQGLELTSILHDNLGHPQGGVGGHLHGTEVTTREAQLAELAGAVWVARDRTRREKGRVGGIDDGGWMRETVG